MLKVCISNQFMLKYVLAGRWFSSKENISFIKFDLHKDFILPIKSNRTAALSLDNKQKGLFIQVETLALEPNRTLPVYLKGAKFLVALCKQVFINKDNSKGILYLISGDIHLSYDQMTTICQKQWNIETFHKPVKSNSALLKSPARIIRTQSNYFPAPFYSMGKTC